MVLQDGHGSTRLLTNSGGSITDRYSFDAYGIMLGGNPSALSPSTTSLLYSGEMFDNDLQQQYLRARYYDQNAGRLNRLDPFTGSRSDPQSLHKYTYVHNNPTNNIDPSGAVSLSLAGQLATASIRFTLNTVRLGAILVLRNKIKSTLAVTAVSAATAWYAASVSTTESFNNRLKKQIESRNLVSARDDLRDHFLNNAAASYTDEHEKIQEFWTKALSLTGDNVNNAALLMAFVSFNYAGQSIVAGKPFPEPLSAPDTLHHFWGFTWASLEFKFVPDWALNILGHVHEEYTQFANKITADKTDISANKLGILFGAELSTNPTASVKEHLNNFSSP